MKVRIHKLFDYLLETTEQQPEAIVGFSLSQSPRLGDFLADLDPNLSLDWNGRSFRGLPELRDRILVQAGLDGLCAPDDVLVTAGAAEANYLALMQLVQPGDRLVIEQPGWPQAEVLGQAIGAEIVKVQRREEDAWRLSLDRLAEAAIPGTKMIFLTNPNNPTGQLLSPEDLQKCVAIARRAGAWLLVDEVYAGLEWDAPRAPSIAGLYEKGITTGSVSKALGLQGLRTGWLICRDPSLVMDAVILRENSSEIMNVLGEHLAEIALRPERFGPALDRAREQGRANLSRLNDFVEATPGLTWQAPRAGLIGLARLPKELDGEDFARRLLAPPYRTFLLPGSAYGEPRHIRLGVGGDSGTNLATGLERLAALLREMAQGRDALGH